jgi:hypothetical protein
MSLLLTVYNTPAWQALVSTSGLPLITDTSMVEMEGVALLQPVQSLAALPALLSQLLAGQCHWLATVQAEYFLANAIENGSALAEAATQWEQQTSAVLTLQRQQRRQLQLFNLQQALAQPAAFRESLKPAAVISDYPPKVVSSSLALLAACQYVAQRPELQALNTRLQASVLPLCDSEVILLDIEQLLRAQQQSDVNLRVTSEERDLILLQLQQVQEQLEQVSLSNATALAATREERDQLERQLASAQQQLEKNNTERKQLIQAQQQSESNWKSTSEERDLILSQLQQVQEQLEHYYLELQAEKQNSKHSMLARDKQQAREMAKLQSELRKTQARAASAEYAGQLLQKELARLRGSISWRAAAPVRVLGRLVRKTNSEHQKLVQDTALVLTSEYFDVEWYLRIYPDVAESKMNPAEHYLLYGAAEGRLPGPLFDGNWYLQQYPDVATAGINPLLHFVKFGQQEGRSSSPKLLTSDSQSAEE